jgi:hypothetical protein
LSDPCSTVRDTAVTLLVSGLEEANPPQPRRGDTADEQNR